MNTQNSPLSRWIIPRSTLVCAALFALVSGASQLVAAQAKFDVVPEACGYLSEDLAANWLRAKVSPGGENEHIPTFWSQCVYYGQGVRSRQTGFVFKFMLFELFDVKSLDDEQLKFNATFASGGTPPLDLLRDLGTISFTYEKGDRSMLIVVTGIQGPPDGVGRRQEFIASYHLSDPETPHKERLERLVVEARKNLAEWFARF